MGEIRRAVCTHAAGLVPYPTSQSPEPMNPRRHPLSDVRTRLRAPLPCLVFAGVTALLSGCSLFHPSSGGLLTTTSSDGSKSLAPTFTTSAFLPVDGDTADVYLSDIPAARFLNAKDTFADAVGTIVHIHIFLVPEAGQTPIDTTACNVTVRQVVLAGPAGGRGISDTPRIGLYAGGGFLYPDDALDSSTVSGSITGASQRLTRSTPDFADLLGPGTVSGKFSAKKDEPLGRAMAAKVESLVGRLPARPKDTSRE